MNSRRSVSDARRLASANADAGISLEPGLVERHVERTEGWIAGLQLAAISLRDRPDPAALIETFGGSQRFVFDYLADEVLAGVDAELRALLVRTAVPRQSAEWPLTAREEGSNHACSDDSRVRRRG